MESTKNSIDVKLELKKAWMDKRTSIYLSKNWREIRDYLYERGMTLKKEEIRVGQLRQKEKLQVTQQSTKKKSKGSRN